MDEMEEELNDLEVDGLIDDYDFGCRDKRKEIEKKGGLRVDDFVNDDEIESREQRDGGRRRA